MEDKLKTFSSEGSSETVADVIAAELNDLLDHVLKEDIFVTYYEHNQTHTIPDLVFDDTKNYQSLMWTFPFGKNYAFLYKGA